MFIRIIIVLDLVIIVAIVAIVAVWGGRMKIGTKSISIEGEGPTSEK